MQQQQLPDGAADADKQPVGAQLPRAVVGRFADRPMQAPVIVTLLVLELL
tara:strand:+ start:1012 stop:1161 length:150 start_codon:yes stop_codon:yes gene_type:complete